MQREPVAKLKNNTGVARVTYNSVSDRELG